MIKEKANLIILILVIVIIVFSIACITLLSGNSKKDENKYKDENIKSKVLKEVIENNWNSEYDFGKKESTFDNYDIYFDEGIEVRNIDGNIYNLVFTNKYKKDIIKNVKSTTELEEIIEELGDPDFGGQSINLIGYKYKDMYIFFNGKQASIYRNEDEIVESTEVFEESDSELELVDNIVTKWKDYDIYEKNNTDESINNALIDYAYKGIRVSVVNEKTEIIVYNNCKLTLPSNSIYTIVTKNKNLIYEVESERQKSIHNTDHIYEQYQLSVNNLPPDFEENESEFERINSNVFIEIQSDMNLEGEYNLKFVCINGKYPNFELNERIYSSAWIDDYNIAYSIKNEGVYLYNLKKREKTILKESKDELYIYGVTEENKLRVDSSDIDVKI